MIDSLKPLHNIYKLHTKLFIKSLENVSNESGRIQLTDKTNNISFIATHILDARFYLGKYIGLKLNNPFEEKLKDVVKIDDMNDYPDLEEIRNLWNEISAKIADRFEELTEKDLINESEVKFPIDDKSKLGGITFLIDHESYHIGQLGFLRKSIGLNSTRYD